MSYLESLWTGFCALRVNRMRSALTTLGIVIGVGAVICMMSVGMGAESDVAEKIRTLGTNLLLVKPGAQISGATQLGAGTAHTLTEDDALSIRRGCVASRLLRRCSRVLYSSSWETEIGRVSWRE